MISMDVVASDLPIIIGLPDLQVHGLLTDYTNMILVFKNVTNITHLKIGTATSSIHGPRHA